MEKVSTYSFFIAAPMGAHGKVGFLLVSLFHPCLVRCHWGFAF